MNIIPFITVLAWIFGVLATLLTIARIYGYLSYSDLEKTIDELRGFQQKRYPITASGLLAIACWAWIFTQ